MKPKMKRVTFATLAAVVFLAAATQSVRAQSQDAQTPDAQQLKERVKQLEQTVEELKGQIKAVEDAQDKKAAAASGTAAPVGETVASKSDSSTVKPAVAGAAQDAKKTGGTFEIYGFAMLDAGYQFGQNDPSWFDTVRPTKLAAFKDEFAPSGHTYFSVRQSRLGVRSTTPT